MSIEATVGALKANAISVEAEYENLHSTPRFRIMFSCKQTVTVEITFYCLKRDAYTYPE